MHEMIQCVACGRWFQIVLELFVVCTKCRRREH
jgi:hypothetical protein